MGYSSHADAKLAGWFSRKHRTNEMHSAASEAKHEKYAQKYLTARERTAVSAKRTLAEKVENLDRMFGTGVGATKERARLALKVELAKQPKKVVVATEPKLDKSAQSLKGKAAKA